MLDERTKYDTYSAKLFKPDHTDLIFTWELFGKSHHDQNQEVNFQILGRKLGETVEKYELRLIPREFKRSKNDQAKLLIIITDKGAWAKRHNNSQALKIEL